MGLWVRDAFSPNAIYGFFVRAADLKDFQDGPDIQDQRREPSEIFPRGNAVKLTGAGCIGIYVFPASPLLDQEVFKKVQLDTKRAYAKVSFIYFLLSSDSVDMETQLRRGRNP